MKLWLISQDVNNGYDTFDAAVVAAETEEEAKHMHPLGREALDLWAKPEFVKAEYIGEAAPDTEKSVILASFNAG